MGEHNHLEGQGIVMRDVCGRNILGVCLLCRYGVGTWDEGEVDPGVLLVFLLFFFFPDSMSSGPLVLCGQVHVVIAV